MTLSISLIVPTDAEGVDCGALDQLLGEHKSKSTMTVDEKHPFWSMVYLIPTYNNPRGMCFPPGELLTLVLSGPYIYIHRLSQRPVQLSFGRPIFSLNEEKYCQIPANCIVGGP